MADAPSQSRCLAPCSAGVFENDRHRHSSFLARLRVGQLPANNPPHFLLSSYEPPRLRPCPCPSILSYLVTTTSPRQRKSSNSRVPPDWILLILTLLVGHSISLVEALWNPTLRRFLKPCESCKVPSTSYRLPAHSQKAPVHEPGDFQSDGLDKPSTSVSTSLHRIFSCRSFVELVANFRRVSFLGRLSFIR